MSRRAVIASTHEVVAGLLTGHATSVLARIFSGMLTAALPFAASDKRVLSPLALVEAPGLGRSPMRGA